ncbi:MAG: DUF192 domain-containing protein [Candidatus Omnitrophica bacterium]|nr:DUF192 domain-containing protein [Candidatus Omnitrophota bacterium]
MIATNQTKESLLAEKIWVAQSFFERLKGLIGEKPLDEHEALLIPFCNGVHTFGMSFPIDVIYMDQQGKVLATLNTLKPNSFGPINFHSAQVLELPEGTIKQTQTQPGDVIMFADTPSLFPIAISHRNMLNGRTL